MDKMILRHADPQEILSVYRRSLEILESFNEKQ